MWRLCVAGWLRCLRAVVVVARDLRPGPGPPRGRGKAARRLEPCSRVEARTGWPQARSILSRKAGRRARALHWRAAPAQHSYCVCAHTSAACGLPAWWALRGVCQSRSSVSSASVVGSWASGGSQWCVLDAAAGGIAHLDRYFSPLALSACAPPAPSLPGRKRKRANPLRNADPLRGHRAPFPMSLFQRASVAS